MKYVIADLDWEELVSYFGGTRTTPEGNYYFRASKLLKHANIYDTFEDAEDEIMLLAPDLSEHEILEITEKELFIARLKGK